MGKMSNVFCAVGGFILFLVIVTASNSRQNTHTTESDVVDLAKEIMKFQDMLSGKPFDPPRYGWYSDAQFEQTKNMIEYETPEGNRVYVTEVTEDNEPFGMWKDYRYVGRISKLVDTKSKSMNLNDVIYGGTSSTFQNEVENVIHTNLLCN